MAGVALSGLALLRNRSGRILLLRTRGHWRLPGGPARRGETAPAACQRHVLAQTGQYVYPSRILAVLHTPAHAADIPEGTAHIFDGERVTGPVTLAPGFTAYRWTTPDTLADGPIKHALDTLHGAPVRYVSLTTP